MYIHVYIHKYILDIYFTKKGTLPFLVYPGIQIINYLIQVNLYEYVYFKN